MTHRVPVVVTGAGAVSQAFQVLLSQRGDILAGEEGLVLDVGERLGPEPSVLVDTTGDLSAVVQAVRDGHAAVTTELGQLVANPAAFAVLRSDRRLGLGAALLPGLPVAETLTRLVESGDVPHEVQLHGGSPAHLVAEALAVAALMGVQLRPADVDVQADDGGPEGGWKAVVGPGRPAVRRCDGQLAGDLRAVTITSRRAGEGGLRLSGGVGGQERVVGALLADLVALARQRDTPWRVHRRLRAGAA